jgi:hypothetical protein
VQGTKTDEIELDGSKKSLVSEEDEKEDEESEAFVSRWRVQVRKKAESKATRLTGKCKLANKAYCIAESVGKVQRAVLKQREEHMKQRKRFEAFLGSRLLE